MYKEINTYTATIYIGGDLNTARSVCRKFVMKGLCVTVEPTEFIYTGGSETGVRVGLINYPKFPATETEIQDNAYALAETLRSELCQRSYTIVYPDKTFWSTNEKEAQ